METLYLYGPPASGKSTLARRLSEEFGVGYVDLDAEIVRRIGMPISQFFAERGEAAFREIESQALREVAAPIVALGGGTLLRDENREFAEKNGFVAVLDVDDEEIARRIELAKGTRPLGNKLAERRAHYAGFRHHVAPDTRIVLPGLLAGDVAVPLSKSHVHRILIADFLAGAHTTSPDGSGCGDFCEDIAATRRCIAALSAAAAGGERRAVLDCGESGSTLRFMAPIAAALGVEAEFVRRGRLAQRPMMDFPGLRSGRHALAGDISSQFVTGLLFALPLLGGDSEIVFTSPLQSRGYVDMTLDVIRAYSIRVEGTPDGFRIPGSQRYVRPEGGLAPEGDWSGAAFWFAANALGSRVRVTNLSDDSRQPDRAIAHLAAAEAAAHPGETVTIDVSQFPDLYPALAVAAAARNGVTSFVNAGRLRIKESDRIAAMESVLCSFGVSAESTPDTSTVTGAGAPFASCEVETFGDHRIAMAAAVAATRASGPVLIHGASCVAKSYPPFFEDFASLRRGGK